MTSVSSAALKYWFKYRWFADGKWTEAEWSTLSTSPIRASNYYHDHMQKHVDRDGYNKIKRPKLKPDQYELLEFRRDGFSPYDLPLGRNPDLCAPKAEPVKNEEFGFAPECEGQGKLA